MYTIQNWYGGDDVQQVAAYLAFVVAVVIAALVVDLLKGGKRK